MDLTKTKFNHHTNYTTPFALTKIAVLHAEGFHINQYANNNIQWYSYYNTLCLH